MDIHALTPLLTCLAWGWLVAAVVMLAMWMVQVVRKDATLVDVAWTVNLALLAALYAWIAPVVAEHVSSAPGASATHAAALNSAHGAMEGIERRLVIALLVAAWALRLASHLVVDRVIGKPEDGRYKTLRANWGANANRNFFVFFQAQALLDAVLSLPFALVCLNSAPKLHALEWIGIALWFVAISGESLADRQLAQFKKEPNSRGKTCRRGLWNYSRHPNYFFEWLHWVAYALIALAAPLGWLALSSPAIMLYLLWKVTGIPATEAHALKSRGQDFVDYQRTTSAFVPWFKKRADAPKG